ncbi:MAG: hypothetical protein V9G12_11795 [Microthrixaceae bacterium]
MSTPSGNERPRSFDIDRTADARHLERDAGSGRDLVVVPLDEPYQRRADVAAAEQPEPHPLRRFSAFDLDRP